MPSSKRNFKNISRACLILVYVSFYLVQLNWHFGKTPAESFWNGDFIAQRSTNANHALTGRDTNKDSRTTGVRLNKRFHPSYLFTAPELIQDLVTYSFKIHVPVLNETPPLTNYAFNSPSLRGPPSVV